MIITDSLLSFLVVFILIMGLISITTDRMDTVNSIEEASEVRMLGENIAEKIETTYYNGAGYYTTFRTPSKISNKYYSVHINSSGLFIEVDGKTCYSHIIFQRVSGSVHLRDLQVTMKPDKTYNISNIQDKISNTWIVVREV